MSVKYIDDAVSNWHKKPLQNLSKLFRQKRLGHATLIQAPEGVGALSFVYQLIEAALCQNPKDFLACKKCKDCLLFESNNHPDVYQLAIPESKSTIGVDQIRELTRSLANTAQINLSKFAIIDHLGGLTLAAANALLKTLEEPTTDTYLFLLSDLQFSALPTIQSRCQRWVLDTPRHEVAERWLQQQCIMSHPQDLIKALALAGGGPIKAKDYLENNIFEWLTPLLLGLEKGEKESCVLSLSTLVPKGAEVEVGNCLIGWIDFILKARHKGQQSHEKAEFYANLSINDAISDIQWFNLLEKVLNIKQLMQRTGANKVMLLEQLLITWFEMTTSRPVGC
ncbi:MAG: hypothetical protein AAGB12_07735 [Pseudomonadota bacterium]